ncbi:hypothetical protein RYH73_26620, partial [Olivibacter sp. CPCC 100613]
MEIKGDKLVLKATQKLSSEEQKSIRNNKEITTYISENKDKLLKFLSNAEHVSFSTNVVSVYRLSGLQEGMLFHELYGEEPGAYTEQYTAEVGDIDPSVF